jgi:mannitol-1-phosphate/altronate dehydrogenase
MLPTTGELVRAGHVDGGHASRTGIIPTVRTVVLNLTEVGYCFLRARGGTRTPRPREEELFSGRHILRPWSVI